MYHELAGGEKNTIEFMESHSMVTSSAPLLDEVYAYGVVEHPFPLNCFISGWSLGPEFYQAVKVGIVQYVSSQNNSNHCLSCTLVKLMFCLTEDCFTDVTENDMRFTCDDFPIFWYLWGGKV